MDGYLGCLEDCFKTLFLYLSIFCCISEQKPGVLHEVCQWEEFHAKCGKDHLILMETSRYGRMKLGKCLTTDYFVGCSADVLSHVDSKCSGRQTCNIDIPDPKLFKVQPCRKDLVAYFSASYACVKVQAGNGAGCHGQTISNLPLDGYLASYITELTGMGSSGCPWHIKVNTGQFINLTLYDFAAWNLVQSERRGQSARTCHIVGKIREEDIETEIRSCVGYQRKRLVYKSSTSEIEIELQKPSSSLAGGYYLIQYSTTGCPNMAETKTMFVKRKGDVMMVGCRKTSQTWHLVCTGSSWAGEIGNCTSDGSYKLANDQMRSKEEMPYGLFIAIGIGAILGIILGLIFLVVVLICKKRRSRTMLKRAKEVNTTYICRELDYPEHPDVAYKLMELRHNPNQPVSSHVELTDPRRGNAVVKFHPVDSQMDGGIYDRTGFDMDHRHTIINGDVNRNCQSCIYDKTPFTFDLLPHNKLPLKTDGVFKQEQSKSTDVGTHADPVDVR